MYAEEYEESYEKDLEHTDYNTYELTVKEYLVIATLACTFFFLIGYIFYNNIMMAILFALLGFFYPKLQRKKLLDKRKKELSQQFQQALFSLSSSLVAGRSIENAFLEVTKDLYLLYPDPETKIIREFELINKRIANRETIESALLDFSERAGIDDITSFTDVFVTCKRTGGDLVEVIRRTSTMISEKIEIEQEINIMIAQKRFESNAILLTPILMVALLSYSSSDYMAPLYKISDLGPFVMSVCLIIMGFSYVISQKIMNIKV